MREWCGCGAAVRAGRRDVLAWREQHRCVPKGEDPPMQYGGDANTQVNGQQTWFEDRVIGFRPNP